MQSAADSIAILDAGAQYGKVIDRRVRDLNVESILVPFSTSAEELRKYKAIILSGGPQSVYGAAAPKYDPKIFSLGIPILGVCYGMQLINHHFGGKVERLHTREDGQFSINISQPSRLFDGLGSQLNVLLTHGDTVTEVAQGFHKAAVSTDGIVAAIENPSQNIFGVQFHPEVDLTERGSDLFKNFLFKIAGCSGKFTMGSRKEHAIAELRRRVGNNKVLVLVSGGVDSSVCAALLRAAVPAEQIFALHIDSGFMRKNESSGVAEALTSIGLNLKVVDASETFFNATTMIDGVESQRLNETVLPEVKRKIIGDTFMRVSEEYIKSFNLKAEEVLLAQGTLRPDLIESASEIASGHADVIKTHHNDTAMVRVLRKAGRIVEPLQDYHKDEVRVLGTQLGLPEPLVWRQPFPGPGLAIRIICATEPYLTAEDDSIVAKLDAFNSASLNATLLPCRTVGVQGDCRSYSHLVSLSSAFESKSSAYVHDGIDWRALMEIAKRVPKTVHHVNRVVYTFGKPLPAGKCTTITPTKLTPDCIKQLQEADDIVGRVLYKHGLIKKLSQVPVILFPVDFGVRGARGICIRTFMTHDFMTGVPALPGKDIPFDALEEMVVSILTSVPGIARVCYDLTAKPPGTTEWE